MPCADVEAPGDSRYTYPMTWRRRFSDFWLGGHSTTIRQLVEVDSSEPSFLEVQQLVDNGLGRQEGLLRSAEVN